MELFGIPEMVEGPLPARVIKVLAKALEYGWALGGPGVTTVARFHKPDDKLAKPFFISWTVHINPENGKVSHRFSGARASNGQEMNYMDVLTYLEDTSVIYPEPPEDE